LIKGTRYDSLLNGLIDSINHDNRPNQAIIAATACVAIAQFLMANHEVEAGAPWLEKARPLVSGIVIHDPVVDRMYERLVEEAK